MSRCIIITGANGFIGSELVNRLSSAGWKVKAFVHSQPSVKIPGVEYIGFDLEKENREPDFNDAELLVHCAYIRYDQNKNADEINIAGTKRLIAICRKKNIKPIFISSFSAHPGAQSHYGKNKLVCESLFDLSKDLILRPGLVVGKGGLAARIIQQIGRSSRVPLAGADQPIQTIAVEDLCAIIERAANTGDIGLYHVAEPKAITLRMFYEEIASQMGKKIRFIPIPIGLLYAGCKFFELFGVKLPVSSENVLGLKQLIKFDTTGDLRTLNVSVKNYKENIKSALK